MPKSVIPKKKCIVCRTRRRVDLFYCLDCALDRIKQPIDTYEPGWAVERALKIERARRSKK